MKKTINCDLSSITKDDKIYIVKFDPYVYTSEDIRYTLDVIKQCLPDEAFVFAVANNIELYENYTTKMLLKQCFEIYKTIIKHKFKMLRRKVKLFMFELKEELNSDFN